MLKEVTALLQEYCGLIPKDEQQLQFFLKIVQEHQKKFPDSRKKTLKAIIAQH